MQLSRELESQVSSFEDLLHSVLRNYWSALFSPAKPPLHPKASPSEFNFALGDCAISSAFPSALAATKVDITCESEHVALWAMRWSLEAAPLEDREQLEAYFRSKLQVIPKSHGLPFMGRTSPFVPFGEHAQEVNGLLPAKAAFRVIFRVFILLCCNDGSSAVFLTCVCLQNFCESSQQFVFDIMMAPIHAKLLSVPELSVSP